MEKGNIKITKNVSGFLKEKKLTVPKIFILKPFAPESGSRTYNCEYELDENNKIIKLIIEGQEVGFKQDELQKLEAKETREKQNERLKETKHAEKEKFKIRISKLNNDAQKIDEAPEKFLLPKDTLGLLKDDNQFLLENISLKLNKCARYESSDKKFSFFKTNRGKIDYKIEFAPVIDQNMIKGIILKNHQNALGFCKENLQSMTFSPDWRMVVGLGNESVYETSMTLHHVFGIPYIPASSIKGIVRSWIITEHFGSKTAPENEVLFPMVNAEYRALMNDIFCKTFGCPKTAKKVKFSEGKPEMKRDDIYIYEDPTPTALGKENRGNIIFFDAFPMEIPNIEPDIMNVHYPNYYGGSDPPTDFQNPNPVFFLTVKNTPFQFLVGSVKNDPANLKIGKRTITDWLKEALEEHGIGAKTAVGYGRLTQTANLPY